MNSSRPVRFLDPTTPPHTFTLTALASGNALSMSIFLPSLAAMAVHFETSFAFLQLSVSLYLVMTAVMQVLLGPISDRYGRRPVLIVSIAVFALATIGTLVAPNVGVFLFFRMLQSAVAAGLVLSRAIVRDTVPGDQAASKIAYITMGMALVPMVAPAIGGFLGGAFGWRASFLTLLLVGIFMFWLVLRDLGETHVSGGGTFADQVRQYPELFRSQRFWGYTLTATFASGTFFSYLGGAAYVGDHLLNTSEGTLGLLMGCIALGYMGGNFIAGRFTQRIGMNLMMLAGTVTTTVTLIGTVILTGLFPHSPVAFFVPLVGMGIGNGLALPNANAGSVNVRPHLAGSASGLSGALILGGGAAISAVAGTVITGATSSHPLLWLMIFASALSIVSALWVLRRERVVMDS